MWYSRGVIVVFVGMILPLLHADVLDDALLPRPLKPRMLGVSRGHTKSKRFLRGAEKELVTLFCRENVDSPKRLMRHGVLIKRPEARATVLICHGYMCDKYYVSFLHHLFRNCNTMTFDFRAHGEDTEGQCCTFGRDEAYDVLAAVRFLKRHSEVRDKPLFVYGFSMGAVATIIASAIDPMLADGLILDTPFESSDKVLERGLGKMRFSFLGYQWGIPGADLFQTHAYNPYVQSVLKTLLRTFASMDSTAVNTSICPLYPEEAIRYCSMPAFFIGCKNDEHVPEEAVRAVYANKKHGYNRLLMMEGRCHCDHIFVNMDEYAFRLNRFIRIIVTGKHKKRKRHRTVCSRVRDVDAHRQEQKKIVQEQQENSVSKERSVSKIDLEK